MTDRPILVVDDDPTILATVSETLDMEGYPVVTATNGREALEAVERDSPTIVLLDMRMPVLDGWGFMRVARERHMNLKVVVMTAAADARRWAAEIGAQGVLAKPFELDELIAAVERMGPASAPQGCG
jgi:CheY-like chemotaxis protein